MLKRSSVLGFVGAIIFSVACLLPARWLGQQIVGGLELTGALRWLVLAFVWCATCAGAAAIFSFLLFGVVERMRGLLLRLAAIVLLAATVGFACESQQVAAFCQAVIWLLGWQAAG